MSMTTFQIASDSSPISLSSTFILPEEKRPKLDQISHLNSISIINLSHPRESLISSVRDACEKYGFFLITNHGVPYDLCKKVLTRINEFFGLPAEERKQYVTKDHTKPVKIFNYYFKTDDGEEKRMWSETLTHPWHPVNTVLDNLPEKPPKYRDDFPEYAKAIGGLMDGLLSLMSQGLKLEEGFLKERLGTRPAYHTQANYYPPCPEPEKTIGLGEHCDLGSLTVLLQSEDVAGLQVLNNGKWISVEPIPNSLVVNLGDQIQVLSNDRYKSVRHRAVTNKLKPRISLAMFYPPNDDVEIEPIEYLIDAEHPKMYRKYTIKEFMQEFYKQEGKQRKVKEAFELTSSF